jgi:hypothetical protein
MVPDRLAEQPVIAFQIIPPGALRTNGDVIIYVGELALAVGAIIALWRRVSRWAPIASTATMLKAVVAAIWRILYGTPFEHLQQRRADKYVTPMIAAFERRISDQIDALASTNDTQHAFVEGELGAVKLQLAGVNVRLTLVEDAVRTHVGPIAKEAAR